MLGKTIKCHCCITVISEASVVLLCKEQDLLLLVVLGIFWTRIWFVVNMCGQETQPLLKEGA